MSKSTSKKRIFFRKGSGLESIHQPHVRDYRETGRSKKRYQELLGLNFLDRQYQGKRILDFGSGPELLAPREIIREYLDAGLTPPHIVALSPAFFDDDIRTHALDKVRADGFEKYISVVAGYGHELPFSVKSFGLICAVHVFQHLHEDDIVPTLAHLLNSLTEGAQLIITPLLRLRTVDEVVAHTHGKVTAREALDLVEDAERITKASPQRQARERLLQAVRKLHLSERGFTIHDTSPALALAGTDTRALAQERLVITKEQDVKLHSDSI